MIDSAINDYRAKEVRQALEPSSRSPIAPKVLLPRLAHFPKPPGHDPLMLVSGSAAFATSPSRRRVRPRRRPHPDHDDPGSPVTVIANPSRVLHDQEQPGPRRSTVTGLPHRATLSTPTKAKPDLAAALHRRTRPRSVRDVLRTPQPSRPHDRLSATAATWLTTTHATDKAPSAEVKKAATKAGFTRTTLARRTSALGVHRDRRGFPALVLVTPVIEAQSCHPGGTIRARRPVARLLGRTLTADTPPGPWSKYPSCTYTRMAPLTPHGSKQLHKVIARPADQCVFPGTNHSSTGHPRLADTATPPSSNRRPMTRSRRPGTRR